MFRNRSESLRIKSLGANTADQRLSFVDDDSGVRPMSMSIFSIEDRARALIPVTGQRLVPSGSLSPAAANTDSGNRPISSPEKFGVDANSWPEAASKLTPLGW